MSIYIPSDVSLRGTSYHQNTKNIIEDEEIQEREDTVTS
jgi:hypothetical protein